MPQPTSLVEVNLANEYYISKKVWWHLTGLTATTNKGVTDTVCYISNLVQRQESEGQLNLYYVGERRDSIIFRA